MFNQKCHLLAEYWHIERTGIWKHKLKQGQALGQTQRQQGLLYHLPQESSHANTAIFAVTLLKMAKALGESMGLAKLRFTRRGVSETLSPKLKVSSCLHTMKKGYGMLLGEMGTE